MTKAGSDVVTLADIARAAGVSPATVSRVLTGSRTTGEDVAMRVRDIASRMGYQPNFIARSLRLQSTSTIGLVVPDVTNPFFPALIQSVAQVLHASGHGVLLADCQNDVGLERENVELLLNRQVDGLLISPCHRTASQDIVALATARLPVVQLDRQVGRVASFVGVDQDAAMAQVLRHLDQQGCRHFAFLASDQAVSTSYERERAYRRDVVRLDPDGADRVLVGNFSIRWGREAIGTALARWPEIDAVVCASDDIAFGALTTLASLGIDVPGTIAVTGFDNGVLAEATSPSLTSVRQPVAEMAERAVAQLLGRPAPRTPRTKRLQAELIVRRSSLAGRRPRPT